MNRTDTVRQGEAALHVIERLGTVGASFGTVSWSIMGIEVGFSDISVHPAAAGQCAPRVRR